MSKIIIANWKANPESIKVAKGLLLGISQASKKYRNITTVICPPFPFLFLKNNLKIKNVNLGSQNVFEEDGGAWTGEVTTQMLIDFGVSYTIIGHSERRAMGEDNSLLNKKIFKTLHAGIKPILCIGEEERDKNGQYLLSIKNDILECLAGVNKKDIKDIIIAYEPLWAIGKNAKGVATPNEFLEMKIFIKKVLSEVYGIKIAETVNVIYGGSVNSENASAFMVSGNADGLLVGRDSLNINKFDEILKAIFNESKKQK